MARSGLRLAVAGALAGVTAVIVMPAMGGAQPAAPKLYVGLFGDNSIGVIDTSTNRMVKTIPIPTGPHGLVITPDGTTVYASSDGDAVVSVISTSTDEVTSGIDVGMMPHGLAITPDGSRVLVAGFGTDQIEAIDTRTNQIAWKTSVRQPHNIAITPDGTTAYAASQAQDGPSLAVLDLATGTLSSSVPLDHTPRALTVSPDGEYVDFTQAGVDSLQVLGRDSNELIAQIPTGASPHHPLFSLDGKLAIVVAQGPGELDLFDAGTDATRGVVKVGDMPHWIALGADGRVAYVSNEKSNSVSVVDLMSTTVTATIPVGSAPRKLAIQPGSPMAVSSAAAQATIAKFAFDPPTMSVSAGQSVTWTNADPVDHTVTGDSGTWASDPLASGGAYSMTFSQPGTYTYHCAIHPFMKGTVVVT